MPSRSGRIARIARIATSSPSLAAGACSMLLRIRSRERPSSRFQAAFAPAAITNTITPPRNVSPLPRRVQPVGLEPELDEHDRDDPLEETEQDHGEDARRRGPADRHGCGAGEAAHDAAHDAQADQDRQAGRHALVERQEVDQRFGDGDEDLADPVDAEPVGEPDRHGEDRPAHERGHRPHGEPAPQLDRPALPGDDPRAGHGERGDERRGDDQHPAERDLLPHQLEVGELRVQADERDVDGTGAAEQTGADDRARRDLAHHTFSASLDPSRPPGRKIRTRTRTRNVNASFSWNEEGIP